MTTSRRSSSTSSRGKSRRRRRRYKPYRFKKTGVYNKWGDPIWYPERYAATGAKTYTKAGGRIWDPVAYSNAVEASCRQNTSSPKYLYHYTDDSSLEAIKRSGYIKSSVGPGDCALGEGVYFTAKPPRSSTGALLENNYGSQSWAKSEKTQGYVRVDADKVDAKSGRDQLGRDVRVVEGDVSLASSGSKTGHRTQW